MSRMALPPAMMPASSPGKIPSMKFEFKEDEIKDAAILKLNFDIYEYQNLVVSSIPYTIDIEAPNLDIEVSSILKFLRHRCL